MSVISGRCAGHLPSCLIGGGRTLRRLLPFQSRAAVIVQTRPTEEALIRTGRAHELPTARSTGPSGGGAERGGDI